MDAQLGLRMNLLSLGMSSLSAEFQDFWLTVSSEDGGGIRGLSSLFILENIMEKIRFIHDLSIEPLPCDYFDMICGTSTGGYPLLSSKL